MPYGPPAASKHQAWPKNVIPQPAAVLPVADFSAVVVSSGAAGPAIFFAENQFANLAVVGTPVTKRAEFLAYLGGGVGSEGFESYLVDTQTPLSIAFPGSTGAITAIISGLGKIATAPPSGLTAGRFNTTPGGANWWEVTGIFTLDFSAPISAFGFYGADIGDFAGSIRLTLRDSTGVDSVLIIPHTVSGANASLLFYGFIDNVKTYNRISFGNTAPGVDFFGFDDMVIGDLAQVVVRVGRAPLTVGFTDQSVGATSWAWDFTNDGSIDSTLQNPTHTYPVPGTYSVRLVATNAAGSHTLTRLGYIVVTP